MDRINIEQKIKEIISNHLSIDIEMIDNDSHFIDDLGGDSLDTVEMMLIVEEEFDVIIEDEVAEELDTPQKVVDYIVSVKN